MQDFSCYVSAVQRRIPKTNVLQFFFCLQQVGFHESSHGKSPFLIGKPSINGPFSMAMLNNQMVIYLCLEISKSSHLVTSSAKPPGAPPRATAAAARDLFKESRMGSQEMTQESREYHIVYCIIIICIYIYIIYYIKVINYTMSCIYTYIYQGKWRKMQLIIANKCQQILLTNMSGYDHR